MIVVLMGVSGSGKTTIGTLLAERAGVVFADGDDFHSEANKAKMHAGHPLTDEDREPWLETLNKLMRGWWEAGTGGVIACSALKASYRAVLRAEMPPGTVTFVLLDASKALIEERLETRHHAFMNPGLLDSQIATLEQPHGGSIEVENDRAPAEVVDEILRRVEALRGLGLKAAAERI